MYREALLIYYFFIFVKEGKYLKNIAILVLPINSLGYKFNGHTFILFRHLHVINW